MKYELERWLKERKQPSNLALQDWLHTRQVWRNKQRDVTTRTTDSGCMVLVIDGKRH